MPERLRVPFELSFLAVSPRKAGRCPNPTGQLPTPPSLIHIALNALIDVEEGDVIRVGPEMAEDIRYGFVVDRKGERLRLNGSVRRCIRFSFLSISRGERPIKSGPSPEAAGKPTQYAPPVVDAGIAALTHGPAGHDAQRSALDIGEKEGAVDIVKETLGCGEDLDVVVVLLEIVGLHRNRVLAMLNSHVSDANRAFRPKQLRLQDVHGFAVERNSPAISQTKLPSATAADC